MKRLIFTLAAITLGVVSANAEEIEKIYDFGDIKEINASYNYQINVTYGKSGKVKVVFDKDIEKELDIRYSSQNKSIVMKRNSQKQYGNINNEPIQVYLEMDEITTISISGASKAVFDGKFKAEDLEVELSGASSISDLLVNGKKLEANCSGASKAAISGNFTDDIELDLSGAVKLEYNGNSDILDADLSGASRLNCNGNFSTCTIVCTGASNAEISGKGTQADFECTGASSIDAKEFIVKTAEVELTGASKAKVYATDNLYHNVTRASKMTYYGEGKLHDRSENTKNIVKGR